MFHLLNSGIVTNKGERGLIRVMIYSPKRTYLPEKLFVLGERVYILSTLDDIYMFTILNIGIVSLSKVYKVIV